MTEAFTLPSAQGSGGSSWEALAGFAQIGAGVASHFGASLTHGTTRGMMAEVTGSGFSRGFTSGFIGHYAPVESITEALGYNNVITRTAVAAGLGGTASALNGGSFANGAESAAYVHLYNSETKSRENAQERLQPGDKNAAMKLGEALRGADVREQIKSNALTIDAVASQYGVDSKLIKAIIFEEQTHLLPGEALAESFGVGNTVGLGQVSVGLHGYTREQLLNPTTNTQAIGHHLSTLQSPGASISSIATGYNCGSCSSTTSYGRRVADFYNSF